MALSIREDVLWEIEAPVDDGAEVSAESENSVAEFLIGQTPEGWTELTPLAEALEPGTRYTVRTLPDGQSIDFAIPDLQPGLVWDGEGVSQFNPDLIRDECSQPADFGLFAQNILALVALGGVAAALVLVALITLLFTITRRFSRLRAIERKLERRETEEWLRSEDSTQGR